MTAGQRVLLGTNKGVFVLSDTGTAWQVAGPFCDTWPINHVIACPLSGTLYACGGTPWTGIGLWRSQDGVTWEQCAGNLADAAGEGGLVEGAWSLAVGADGTLYCGTKPAAIFASPDCGDSWRAISGLQRHPSREDWMPGGAGLTLHCIVCHPTEAARLWVGISTAGVFATEDGGESWEPRNTGTRMDYAPEGERYPEVGQCVHNLVRAPSAVGDVLYQQNHFGMYRSDDGGKIWHSIEDGLPSSFGFPVAVHPRDAQTVWFAPMNGDSDGRYPPEGRMVVWRSGDGGAYWHPQAVGLPESAFFTVLRQAMAVDRATPTGVYFGTSSGSVFASRDEGAHWEEIARHLPVILSVECAAPLP